jgi:hypothetical protein
MTDPPLPFKPGDWVSDCMGQPAKVRAVYRDRGEVLLDLVLYDMKGGKVGRESPACGGPRTFEPACAADGWQRIAQPTFPISLKWVDDGDGKRTARYVAGTPLPPANYTPKPRRRAYVPAQPDDALRRALQQIADGHNDPRTLAKTILGQR